MGVYSDYVSNIYAPARTNVLTQTGINQNAAANQARQASMAQGVQGPVATNLAVSASRGAQALGGQQLNMLDTQQRQAMYSAFQQDRQEQIQSDIANRQMWMQGLTGAGSLLGAAANIFGWGAHAASVSPVAGGVPGTN